MYFQFYNYNYNYSIICFVNSIIGTRRVTKKIDYTILNTISNNNQGEIGYKYMLVYFTSLNVFTCL